MELSSASPAANILYGFSLSLHLHHKDWRRRKNKGSSDDSGEELPDSLVDEDLRTGGPYLCAVHAKEQTELRLLEKIGWILLSHEVAFQSVDMCGRRS